MNKLIGISGRKRSGKDSVCDILSSDHGYTKISFTQNLREMCSETFSIGMNHFIADELKELTFLAPIEITQSHVNSIERWLFKHKQLFGVEHFYDLSLKTRDLRKLVGTTLKSPRHILQFVGTDMIRNYVLASYHADVVFDAIANHPGKKYCISDCRFPNERKMVKNNGGITILIWSDNDDLSCPHASEIGVGTSADYDYSFKNSKEGLDKLSVDFLEFYERIQR